MRLQWIFILGSLTLTACQTPPNMQQLQSEKQTLQVELKAAEQEITKLKSERDTLQSELNEANRVIGVMGGEKSARVKESSTLRNEVRRFVQRQIDGLKTFLVKGDLLDYVGGEQVARKKYDNRPLMLVDLQNTVPRPGVLTGVGGYFAKPTQMVVKVLRPVNNDLVVIWESRPIAINKAGQVNAAFPVTVGVEKGDVLGYYFPKPATATFDTGTADTRYTKDNLRPGSKLSPSSLSGKKERRAYALGVYGLLK
ncbi:MAG: hypothetical protein OEU74_00605 [Gammaproteobacteria bacterium]|nr:hypothetical protein [Gammaproteobacteria bacterium]